MSGDLAAFLAAFDEQKGDEVSDQTPPLDAQSLRRKGEELSPLVDRLSERAGVESRELVKLARGRGDGTAQVVYAQMRAGQPPAEAIPLSLASVWLDGFLAGVLWAQRLELERAMGGE